MRVFVVLSLLFFLLSHHGTATVTFQEKRSLMDTDFRRADKLAGSGKKYFWESKFSHHYDGRYANRSIPDNRRMDYLRPLAQAYFETMTNLGIETWIMHGTLLGWWWNQKVMPWDNDLDVQVSEAALWFLWDNGYHLSQHEFAIANGTDNTTTNKRRFVLEINPNFKRRHQQDNFNRIDGRWIDIDSGLFIDLTAVREDYNAPVADGKPGALMCKDKHTFLAEEIFPLRRSTFEGIAVNIPFAYTELLRKEYGGKALSKKHYFGHHFNDTTEEWEKDVKSAQQFKAEQEMARKAHDEQQARKQPSVGRPQQTA